MSETNPAVNIEEYRTSRQHITEHTLGIEGIDAETGSLVNIDSIRQVEIEGEDQFIGRYITWDTKESEMISEEVILPSKFHVGIENTLQKTVRDRGRIIAAGGTIAVSLAIGVGILVKRIRSKV